MHNVTRTEMPGRTMPLVEYQRQGAHRVIDSTCFRNMIHGRPLSHTYPPPHLVIHGRPLTRHRHGGPVVYLRLSFFQCSSKPTVHA